jgi:hypothetical protein
VRSVDQIRRSGAGCDSLKRNEKPLAIRRRGRQARRHLDMKAINLRAALKSLAGPFQHITGGGACSYVVNGAASHNPAALIRTFQHDNLLRVAENGDVCLVGNDNDLMALLGPAEDRHERRVDELTRTERSFPLRSMSSTQTVVLG